MIVLRNVSKITSLIALVMSLSNPALAANTAVYDKAAGEVFAADLMQSNCKGLALVGGADYQSFVLAATELTSQQGLRKQKMRKLLFYGKTDWLQQQAKTVLSDRGVEPNSKGSLCAFAQKVAGTEDAIGRFLVKE